MSTRALDRTVRSVLFLALTATGCGGDVPEPDLSADSSAAPSAGQLSGASALESEDRTVRLTALSGSGVGGEVAAMHTEDAIVLVVEATGLPGPREYGVYLHRERCRDDGILAMPLNPIVGLPDSTGTSTTVLEPSDVAGAGPLSVRLVGVGNAPLACGELSSGPGATDSPRSAVPDAP